MSHVLSLCLFSFFSGKCSLNKGDLSESKKKINKIGNGYMGEGKKFLLSGVGKIPY